MKARAVMPRGLFGLLCIVSFGVLRADATPTDPMYSFSGVYGTYDVSISFDTSLTGAALDNLTSDNITSTVSNFMESNAIPGHGSAALNVTISTDPLGNIKAFSITDTTDQVVTNTEDSGQTPATTWYGPPPEVNGEPLDHSVVCCNDKLYAYYQSGACVYRYSTGAIIADAFDGHCPTTAAIESATLGSPVAASGGGTFTSSPPDPGGMVVPEPTSSAISCIFLVVLALVTRRKIRNPERR